jgi:hypothetical protein
MKKNEREKNYSLLLLCSKVTIELICFIYKKESNFQNRQEGQNT